MGDMQLAVIPVTPFQQNCSVLWCERTRAAAAAAAAARRSNPYVSDADMRAVQRH